MQGRGIPSMKGVVIDVGRIQELVTSLWIGTQKPHSPQVVVTTFSLFSLLYKQTAKIITYSYFATKEPK